MPAVERARRLDQLVGATDCRRLAAFPAVRPAAGSVASPAATASAGIAQGRSACVSGGDSGVSPGSTVPPIQRKAVRHDNLPLPLATVVATGDPLSVVSGAARPG
jgi:hypothetical protein